MNDGDRRPSRQLIRVLAIYNRMRCGERITVNTMAKDYRVHSRTIRRDLAALDAAGAPLIHDGPENDVSIPGGGTLWWFVRGWFPRDGTKEAS